LCRLNYVLHLDLRLLFGRTGAVNVAPAH
jgi:hypothetical protein